jgi:gliding motility-associated-like protein
MTLLALCLSLPFLANGQTNEVVIFPGAEIFAHPNSFTNVFSNVTTGGTFKSADGALVNFYGRIWTNQGGSSFPDESPGGIDGVGGFFRFSGQFSNAQRIVSIGSEPFNGFPNLRIDNLLNVTLETGNLHVNNNLDFVNGKIVLNSVDLNVGRDGLGTITGYSRANYVVTGSAMTGGSLIRSFTGSTGTPADFPVGTSITSYTPASIIYKGLSQNIKLRVADNLYNKLNFPEYLTKTWIIQREFSDATGTIDLTLQHNSADEGTTYFKNRNDAYVTRYDQRLEGLYDILPPHPTSTPGTISTRGAVSGAYMNTRLNIGALKEIEYFSKSVIKKQVDENTPVNIPDAISPNGDGLNDTYIVVKRTSTDKVRFEVYTRNQVPVYQNLDYDNSFDGTGNLGGFMGDVLPDGIYYYLISVNGAKGIPGYLILNR